VLCVDEKPQIQALDRSAPVLPLMPGVPARQTHDYVRNGTTNLYAALDVASGQVISEMTPRHRAEEFRRFLNLIDSSVPADLDVHVVLDNSSTHKTPSMQRWLVRHPRFTQSPTSGTNRRRNPRQPRRLPPTHQRLRTLVNWPYFSSDGLPPVAPGFGTTPRLWSTDWSTGLSPNPAFRCISLQY
jgi:DDE superfamily endonuclease